MMRRRTMSSPSTGLEASPAPSGEATLWLVSDSIGLIESIQTILEPCQVSTTVMNLDAMEADDFRRCEGQFPAIILLDIGGDVDRGWKIVRHLKRAQPAVPMVVLTQVLSRKFGEKIISEGVRYYFSHDFCKEELVELVHSLLKRE
jgi:DNA-binding NarL/FixJ family response regulator